MSPAAKSRTTVFEYIYSFKFWNNKKIDIDFFFFFGKMLNFIPTLIFDRNTETQQRN